MKIIYPDKNFSKLAKRALDARDTFEIIIAPSRRARRLAEEVDFWPKTGTKNNTEPSEGRSPTFIFSMFNITFVAFHWFALSAGYEMQSNVRCAEVHLVYFSKVSDDVGGIRQKLR